MSDFREDKRIQALKRLDLLDTDVDAGFDALVELAVAVTGTPMAAISLVDENRQWFKARTGIAQQETPRADAICPVVLESDALVEIPDAKNDPRFAESSMVHGSACIRGYAGIAIHEPGGERIGVLCVMDSKPLNLDAGARQQLVSLARLVEDRIASEFAAAQGRAANAILDEIAREHGDYLADPAVMDTAFRRLLELLAEITGTGIAFLGEMLEDDEGRLVRAQVFVESKDDRRDFESYGLNAAVPLEYRCGGSLAGEVAQTGERMFCNAPAANPLARPMPNGEFVDNFAGIPVRCLGEVVAIVSLANREGGYTDRLLDSCEPLIQVIGDLNHARRSARARFEAQQRLERSERRFQLALNGVSAGIWEIDMEEGTLFTSNRLLEILGRTASEGQARGTYARNGIDLLLSRVHPEDRHRVEQGLGEAWNDGTALEMTYRYQHGDGHYIDLFVRGHTQYDENGKAIRMAGSAEDITERMRLVEAEARSRSRLEAVTELGGIGSWEYGFETDTLEWDAITRGIFGVSEDFMPSAREATGLFEPEVYSRLLRHILVSIRKDTTWDLELPIKAGDGRTVWVRAVGKPVFRRGKPHKLLGSLEDISQRKLHDDQMAALSARLAVALNSSGIGAWEFNLDTQQHWWDEGSLRLFGHRPGDDTDTLDFWRECVHPEDRDTVSAVVEAAFEERKDYRSEYRIVRPDGDIRHVRSHGVFRRRLDGTTVVSGVNIDISQDVRTQAEIERRRVEAEAANAAKSQFLANMSHEIRTPLNGVLGMAQILKMTGLDAKQSHYVETLQASGRALLDLIEDVLDISKIESGMAEFISEPFDPFDLVSGAAEVVRPIAEGKGLALQLDLDKTLPEHVLGDAKRVRQVLINMIGNAAKFTDTGSVRVRARALPQDHVRFEVIDTGPGIAADRHKHVFDRFAQVDDSATRRHGGTGLGLTICREIVERNGGRIGVDSRPGEGACFWFELPLPPVEAASEASPVVPLNVAPATSSGGRVLVVDDVETNRIVAAALVSKAGYEVETACNGQEAIDCLECSEFDAVFMDIQMPVMSGDDAIAIIRDSGKPYSNLPIYAVTADATSGARERYLEIGATGYLAKPLDLALVQSALNTLAEERKRA
ncbi:PAS domain-containing protein [Maricaulis parjimensis]|uniref:PAS domain-containing protein n=1 Tax=Maricaulis parjimensis TaxID=144023 RepID=UPI00193A0AE0|nr:PAS domain-containing protein [Maricaulis parjimensis]